MPKVPMTVRFILNKAIKILPLNRLLYKSFSDKWTKKRLSSRPSAFVENSRTNY